MQSRCQILFHSPSAWAYPLELQQAQSVPRFIVDPGPDMMCAMRRCVFRYIGDSSGDLAMAVAFSDNAYHTKDFSCRALPLTANLHTMTSMRAPGVVQSILAHEVVMEHVARVVGLPMDEVQVHKEPRTACFFGPC